MDGLEELKRQKREIEKRIKELSPPYLRCGRASLRPYMYHGLKVKTYQVAVKKSSYLSEANKDRIGYNRNLYDRSYTIIESTNKDKIIEEINEVIEDLTALSRRIKSEEGVSR